MNQILTGDLYESLLIFLSDDVLKSIPKIEMRTKREVRPYFKGHTIPYMQQEAKAILELMKTPEDYREIIKLKIIELLLHIQRLDEEGILQGFLKSLSDEKSFQEKVVSQYEQYCNLEEIAFAMNMSLSTFKRKFQKEFKCTPHYWINERKVMKAMALLDTSEYSITDISFICGFESLSTFMQVFKKKYGVSPGKYRTVGRNDITNE